MQFPIVYIQKHVPLKVPSRTKGNLGEGCVADAEEEEHRKSCIEYENALLSPTPSINSVPRILGWFFNVDAATFLML